VSSELNGEYDGEGVSEHHVYSYGSKGWMNHTGLMDVNPASTSRWVIVEQCHVCKQGKLKLVTIFLTTWSTLFFHDDIINPI